MIDYYKYQVQVAHVTSNAIYIHELYNFYDVEVIIRVGSKSIAPDVGVGDVVAATTAYR